MAKLEQLEKRYAEMTMRKMEQSNSAPDNENDPAGCCRQTCRLIAKRGSDAFAAETCNTPIDAVTNPDITVAAKVGAQHGGAFQQLQQAKSAWTPVLQRMEDQAPESSSSGESLPVGSRGTRCAVATASIVHTDCRLTPPGPSALEEDQLQKEQAEQIAASGSRVDESVSGFMHPENAGARAFSLCPPLVIANSLTMLSTPRKPGDNGITGIEKHPYRLPRLLPQPILADTDTVTPSENK